MACNTDITYQEFYDKALNREYIFEPSSEDGVKDIVDRLDITQKYTTDDTGKYYIKDYLVSDKKIDTKDIPTSGQVFISNLMDSVLNQLVEAYTNDTSMTAALGKAKADMKKDKSFKISDKDLDKILATSKGLLDKIISQQNKIDATQKAIIRTGNRIFDPTRTEMDTVDLIAVYSDKSYSHFSYAPLVPNFGSKARKSVLGKLVDVFTKEPLEGKKLEEYRKPMLRYREILRNNYGLKSARHSQVVPIVVNYKWDKGYTNEITYLDSEYTSQDEQKDLLGSISMTFQETGNTKLDSAIKQKEALIERFGRLRDKYTKDNPKYGEYDLKIKKLRKSINALYDGKELKDYFNEIQQLFSLVYKDTQDVFELKEGEKGYLNNEELNELRLELEVYGETIIAETNDLIENLGQDNADYLKYKDLQEKYIGRINILREKVNAELYDRAIELKEKTGTTGTESESVGLGKKLFTRLSDYNNWLFKTTSNIIQKAIFQKNQEVNQVKNQLDTLQKNFKKAGYTIEQVNDLLIDREKGNLVKPFKQEFYDEKKKAEKNNDTSFVSKYYKPKDNWEELYNQSKKKFEEVLKKEYTEIKDGDIVLVSQQEADDNYLKALTSWENNNRLFNQDGSPNHKAWLNPYSYRYLTLNKEQAAKDNYINPKYSQIQNVPSLKTYYDWIVSNNNKYREMLHLDYEELPDYFIPNIRKSTADILFDKYISSKDKTNQIWNEVKESFSLREDDTFNGERDPETGKFVPVIPKFWIKPLKNKEGKTDYSLKSFDIGKTMILFADMAYNHKYMSEIESDVITLKNVLLSRQQEIIKEDKPVLGKLGQTLERKITKGDDIAQVYEDITNSFLYGTNIAGDDTLITLGNKKISLNKALVGANNYYVSKAIGLNPKVALVSYLGPRFGLNVEASKGVAFNRKQLKESNKILAKYMGSKVFKNYKEDADKILYMVELFQTQTDRHVNIDARKFSQSFFNKNINADVLFSMLRSGESAIDLHMTLAMSMNYGYDSQGNFGRIYDDNGNVRLGKEDYKPIFDIIKNNWKEGKSGLEEFKPEQLLKFRQAVQEESKKIKGTMTYDDKAWFQTQLLMRLLMTFKTWMPGVIGNRFSKLKYNEKLDAVDWGRYSSLFSANSYMAGDTIRGYLKGTLLPSLGKFIAETATFGYLHKTDKWKSLNEARLNRLYDKKKSENPEMFRDISKEDFKGIILQNQRAIQTELRYVLGTALLIFALSSIEGDDERPVYKDSWEGRNFYRLMSRLYTELAFLYSPNEYLNLLGSSIPLIGLARDVQKLIQNTLDETGDLINAEEREGLMRILFGQNKNEKQDKTPLFYRSAKMIKGLNAFSDVAELFEIDEKKER